MQFVLDASIVLSWHFEDESSARADLIAERCLNDQAIVPRHWHLEVANGLLSGERRKRTGPDRIATFLRRLDLIEPSTVERFSTVSCLWPVPIS